MKLLKFKISGHYAVKDSGWVSVHSTRTILAGPHGSGKTTILRALQSINPPAGGGSITPFDDFPQYVNKGGYRRKIMPAKKTAAIAVFVCDPALRDELTAIDPVFYETDRIELGRKLDNSQWTSFIEIANSSRWSEVTGGMAALREEVAKSGLAAELLERYDAITADLKATDRIKDDIASRLEEWLARIEPLLADSLQALVQQARFKIRRAQRFKEAKKLVADRLPLFLYFSDALLVRGKIDLQTIAQKAGKEGFYKDNDFGSFCFLKALGLEPETLTGPAAQESELPSLAAACARLANAIQPFLPEDTRFTLSPRLVSSELHVLVGKPDGSLTPIGQTEAAVHWLISLFSVITALAKNPADRNIILLLDEPGEDLDLPKQKILKTIIGRLSKAFQIIYTAETQSMITKTDLKNIRIVVIKDQEVGTAISKIAAMDQLSDIFD